MKKNANRKRFYTLCADKRSEDDRSSWRSWIGRSKRIDIRCPDKTLKASAKVSTTII